MKQANKPMQDYLSHNLTPDDLGAVNASICAVLAQLDEEDNIDDDKLRRLVEERDTIIQAHLSSLNAEQKDAFAKAELPINSQLQATVKNLFTDSLSELSSLVRGLKAIKKYK